MEGEGEGEHDRGVTGVSILRSFDTAKSLLLLPC